jgi:hypothetical protein
MRAVMKRWLKHIGIALFFSASVASSVKAGNEHEHLQYLPSYLDIEKAAAGKLGHVPSKQLFGSLSMSVCQLMGPDWLKEAFPGIPHVKGNADYVKVMQELIDTTNLSELSEKLAKHYPHGALNTRDVQKMFFEITKFTDHREAYLFAGAIRGNLFQADADLLVRSLENNIDRLPKSESNKILASIPHQFESEVYLQKLQSLFKRKGVQAQLYSSIPRSHLLKADAELQKRLETIRDLSKKGLVQGIDISGSIAEGKQLAAIDASKVKTYDQTLESVLRFSSENHLPIRIHAFEGASQGPFYNSFWQAMEECKAKDCLPKTIRIGHIQALDESEIRRLKAYTPNVQIIFEANIESNLVLQSDSKLSKLVQTIEKIHQYKMPVALGADGLGILGDPSSFEASILRLKKAGLSTESVNLLVKEAFNPVAPLERSTLKTWLAERTRVRQLIFGSEAKRSTAALPKILDHCDPGAFRGFLRSLTQPALKPAF